MMTYIDRMPKIARLINMIFTIQTHPGIHVSELMSKYKVNERQIYRDIRRIEDAEVPIYSQSGNYYIIGNIKHIFYDKLEIYFEGR